MVLYNYKSGQMTECSPEKHVVTNDHQFVALVCSVRVKVKFTPVGTYRPLVGFLHLTLLQVYYLCNIATVVMFVANVAW